MEGKISLNSDDDGDLNVTIKTGKGKYKLFYAHLSNDVTYTCIQTEAKKENPYAYDIQFFPAKEVVENKETESEVSQQVDVSKETSQQDESSQEKEKNIWTRSIY